MKTLNIILAATVGVAMLPNIASADPNHVPGTAGVVGATQGTVVLKPGSLVGLNPQPEPPSKKKIVLKPSGLVGLNPQPEPPSVLLKGTQTPPD